MSDAAVAMMLLTPAAMWNCVTQQGCMHRIVVCAWPANSISLPICIHILQVQISWCMQTILSLSSAITCCRPLLHH